MICISEWKLLGMIYIPCKVNMIYLSEWVHTDLLQRGFTRLRACVPTVLCSIQRARIASGVLSTKRPANKSSHKRFEFYPLNFRFGMIMIFISIWRRQNLIPCYVPIFLTKNNTPSEMMMTNFSKWPQKNDLLFSKAAAEDYSSAAAEFFYLCV